MKTAAKRTALIILSAILFFAAQIIFCGCGYTNPEEKTLRVCVTADSATGGGKSVQSDVLYAVGYYLENVLVGSDGYVAAAERVRERMATVSALTSAVVRKCGGGYGAEASLKENSGGSELIIKLGAGCGGSVSVDIYPHAGTGRGVKYESVLVGIVNRFL